MGTCGPAKSEVITERLAGEKVQGQIFVLDHGGEGAGSKRLLLTMSVASQAILCNNRRPLQASLFFNQKGLTPPPGQKSNHQRDPQGRSKGCPKGGTMQHGGHVVTKLSKIPSHMNKK